MARVPKAVEKQAQLAEDLHAQLYGNTGQPAPDGQPAEAGQPQSQDQTTPPAEQSAPAESTAAPAESAPQENATDAEKKKFPDADPNSDAWEQKYKVIANKYSAEIPRYAQEVRSLKEKIAGLESKIEELKAAPAQQAPVQKVKPEEVEEYGEKFYDFVKRAASEVVPNAPTGDVDKLKESVDAVAKQQRQIATTRFFEELGKLAPQWEQLNTDQEFLEWLNGLDAYTGRPRQDLFDGAYGELDAWRVANFFNAYTGEKPKEPESQTPSLESQVVPSSSRAATPPPSKKFWNTNEVARFYDDCRRGVYNEDEAARIEKDIFAAQAEGRFR